MALKRWLVTVSNIEGTKSGDTEVEAESEDVAKTLALVQVGGGLVVTSIKDLGVAP